MSSQAPFFLAQVKSSLHLTSTAFTTAPPHCFVSVLHVFLFHKTLKCGNLLRVVTLPGTTCIAYTQDPFVECVKRTF